MVAIPKEWCASWIEPLTLENRLLVILNANGVLTLKIKGLINKSVTHGYP